MFRRLTIAVWAIALIFAGVAPASASDETEGFIMAEFAWAVTLNDSSTSILVGSALETGDCAFEFPETEAEAEDVWWYVRSIGIDPVECRLLLEEGWSESPPQLPDDERYAREYTEAEGFDDAQESGASLLAGGAKKGIHNVQWVDPVGIAVNWVRSTLTWQWDTSCATSGQVSGQSNWLTLTGWTRQTWNVTQSNPSHCSWWQSQSDAQFKNSTFCVGFPTTWALYDYVRVRGLASGGATFTRSTSVQGGCSNLLHMEYSTTLQTL